MNKNNHKLIELYLRDVQIGKHGDRPVNAKSRVKRISSTLYYFDIHFFKEKDFKKITQPELEDFFLKYKNGEIKKKNNDAVVIGDYSKNTLMSNWKIWKKFISYVHGWDIYSMPVWLKRLRMMEYGIEKPIDRNEYATKEKLEMISEHLRNPYTRMVLKTLFDFGISYGELMEVKMHQIHYDDENNCFFISLKSGFKDARQTREISYTWYEPDFVLYLKNHPDWNYIDNKPKNKDEFLFPRRTINTFNKTISKASKKLFNEKWTSHWMRRGLITHLENEDVPEGAIKYRTGLSENTSVLSHYNKRSKKQDKILKQALNRSTSDKIKFDSEVKTYDMQKRMELLENQIKEIKEIAINNSKEKGDFLSMVHKYEKMIKHKV